SRFDSEGPAMIFIKDALEDLVTREPKATIALIARDPETNYRVNEIFKGNIMARLVMNGEFTFKPGIDITNVYQVKGLEFDYVIIPDATAGNYPDTSEARRALHIAATRAIHQLWVISIGNPSPILNDA